LLAGLEVSASGLLALTSLRCKCPPKIPSKFVNF
jgi:hypothetical protein